MFVKAEWLAITEEAQTKWKMGQAEKTKRVSAIALRIAIFIVRTHYITYHSVIHP